jgi:hypothetical protein
MSASDGTAGNTFEVLVSETGKHIWGYRRDFQVQVKALLVFWGFCCHHCLGLYHLQVLFRAVQGCFV